MFVSDCSTEHEVIINNSEGGRVRGGFGWCEDLPKKQQKHTQSPVAAELQPEKDFELGQDKTTDSDWEYVQID